MRRPTINTPGRYKVRDENTNTPVGVIGLITTANDKIPSGNLAKRYAKLGIAVFRVGGIRVHEVYLALAAYSCPTLIDEADHTMGHLIRHTDSTCPKKAAR